MKTLVKTEAIGLILLITYVYSLQFPDAWGWFFALFFLPDISFVAYLWSNKWGAYLYNFFHHQAVIALTMGIGWWLEYPVILKIGLIFLAHSFFDRIFGFGLKYKDNFHHTHLGIIGKSRIPKTSD